MNTELYEQRVIANAPRFMRPIILCTFSAAAASMVTWAMMQAWDGAAADQSRAAAARAGAIGGSQMPEARPARESKIAATARGSADRWSSLRDGDGRIGPESMTAAVQELLREGDPLLAMESFSALLRELTPENAKEGWAALSGKLDGAEAMRFLPLFAHAWGALDGPGALAVMKKGNNRDDGMARMNVMGGWATKDPQGSLAWLKEKEAAGSGEPGNRGELRDVKLLRMGLIRGLASGNPDEAMRLVPSLDENERGQMVAMIAREQYQRGMDGAKTWAASIADPELKSQAVSSVVRQFADEDPAKAAAWLAGQSDLRNNAEAVGAVAREWAGKDPASAIPWINSLPEGPARNEAWEDAIRSWSRSDPAASSAYLTQMPAGPSRDSAVSSLSRSIAKDDPDAAIQWAATIQDPAAREAAMVRSVQLWRRTDEDAASEWITGSGFAPEIQQRMMEPAKGRELKPWKAEGGVGGIGKPRRGR